MLPIIFLMSTCNLVNMEPGLLYSFTELKAPTMGSMATPRGAVPHWNKDGKWRIQVRGKLSGNVYTVHVTNSGKPFDLSDEQQFYIRNYSDCETSVEPR